MRGRTVSFELLFNTAVSAPLKPGSRTLPGLDRNREVGGVKGDDQGKRRGGGRPEPRHAPKMHFLLKSVTVPAT
ncbi:hypothetical protein GCM10020001_022560 [Nonomuraea salmonea]